MRGERDGSKDAGWVEPLARVGLTARGVVYGLVALVTLQIALGQRQARADKQGAFQVVARQPFGRGLVVLIAAGLVAYAAWRLVQALVDPAGQGGDAASRATRLGYAGRAVLYLAAFATCLPVILGRSSGGAPADERDLTARVLRLPLGGWIVGVAGLVALCAGAYSWYRAGSQRFREKLRESEMGCLEQRWAVRLAVAGLVARGTVFALVGAFLLRAGVRHDPDRGVGLDAALRELAGMDYGPYVLVVAALGLLAYGVFSLIEVRYRKVIDG